MNAVKIDDKTLWVGALDYAVTALHGHHYVARRGTSYNAYLLLGDETALVDAVPRAFAGELLARVRSAIDPARVAHVVLLHLEPDHAGAVAEVLEAAPQARLHVSKRGARVFERLYGSLREVEPFETGDALALGGLTLRFTEAPMLHWPDSSFAYVPETRTLLPNDAFGQHFYSEHRFADEVDECALWEEYRKYYANILTPFSAQVLAKLDELAPLDVAAVLPSHGVGWRGDDVKRAIGAYRRWAEGRAERRVVVAYDTMYGSTEAMARAVVGGVLETGADARLVRVPSTDLTTLMGELLEARGLAVGSPTLNRGPLSTMAAFLEELVGLRPVGKIGAAFGSYGWGGGATKAVEHALAEARVEQAAPSVTALYRPVEEELARCRELGAALGGRA